MNMKKMLFTIVYLTGISFVWFASSPVKAQRTRYLAECSARYAASEGVVVELYEQTTATTTTSVGRPVSSTSKDLLKAVNIKHAWLEIGPSTNPDRTGLIESCAYRVEFVGSRACLDSGDLGGWQPFDLLTEEYVLPSGRFSRQPIVPYYEHARIRGAAMVATTDIERLSKEDCLYWITHGNGSTSSGSTSSGSTSSSSMWGD